MAVNIVSREKIRRLRETRGWDQYELAKNAGVSASFISRLENENQSDFRLSAIVAVAKALGVGVDDLLLSSHAEPVTQELLPELQQVVNDLRAETAELQQQIANLIRAYLSAR